MASKKLSTWNQIKETRLVFGKVRKERSYLKYASFGEIIAFFVAAYFIINLIFALIYWLCSAGSFNGVETYGWTNLYSFKFFGECIYFSVVSFNTIGFGDISPKGEAIIAKVWLIVEALIFVVYNALFAGLIITSFIRRSKNVSFEKYEINLKQGRQVLSFTCDNKGKELHECEFDLELFEKGGNENEKNGICKITKKLRQLDNNKPTGIDFDLTALENKPLLEKLLKVKKTPDKDRYFFEIILKGIDLTTSQTFIVIVSFSMQSEELAKLTEPREQVNDIIAKFEGHSLDNRTGQTPAGSRGLISKLEYVTSSETTQFVGLVYMNEADNDNLKYEILPEPRKAKEIKHHSWSRENKLLNEKLKHSKWIADTDAKTLLDEDKKNKENETIKQHKRSYFLFKQQFRLDRAHLKSAELYILVDNSCLVFINEHNVSKELDTDIYGYHEASHLSVIEYLKEKENEMYFLVNNIHSNTYDYEFNIYGIRFCLDLEYSYPETEISDSSVSELKV